MSDKQQEQKEQNEHEQLTVDKATYLQMQIYQYDLDIANAEQEVTVAKHKVAQLKSNKAKFILDYTLKDLKEQAKKEIKTTDKSKE